MTCNMGSIDRVIRLILGVGLIIYGIYLKTWWGAVGIIPIFTAVSAWCPAYVPFKISTKKSD